MKIKSGAGVLLFYEDNDALRLQARYLANQASSQYKEAE